MDVAMTVRYGPWQQRQDKQRTEGGFGVGDFDATRAAMLVAEVEFIGAIQHADGLSWQHFRCRCTFDVAEFAAMTV